MYMHLYVTRVAGYPGYILIYPRHIWLRRQCGNPGLKACGMRREVLAERTQVQARGEEHGMFLNSKPGGTWRPLDTTVGGELD